MIQTGRIKGATLKRDELIATIVTVAFCAVFGTMMIIVYLIFAGLWFDILEIWSFDL